MRFILKTAFFLGLIAFLIPFGDRPKDANISMLGAFVGAQQAIADLTGFCDRAPQACDTGRELAVFAGERITDGAALAYSLVQDKVQERSQDGKEDRIAPRSGSSLAAAAPTDPVNTGTLPSAEARFAGEFGAAESAEAAKGPLPYVPPKRAPQAAPVEAVQAAASAPAQPKPRHSGTPAIPTPAPRV